MSKFSWGHSFMKVNGCVLSQIWQALSLVVADAGRRRAIIERYKTCSTPESVLEMQNVMMQELEAEQAENSESLLP